MSQYHTARGDVFKLLLLTDQLKEIKSTIKQGKEKQRILTFGVGRIKECLELLLENDLKVTIWLLTTSSLKRNCSHNPPIEPSHTKLIKCKLLFCADSEVSSLSGWIVFPGVLLCTFSLCIIICTLWLFWTFSVFWSCNYTKCVLQVERGWFLL